MIILSRRDFFRKTAADALVAGFLAGRVARVRANPLGLPIGSQTYPHRMMLKKDFPGLMKEPMPSMIFLPLWNLTMAFLFAIVFEKWANIRTFVDGLKGGFLLMLLIALIIDRQYVAFTNIFNGPVALIIDVGAATALGTLAAGAVGAVLGLMNKEKA